MQVRCPYCQAPIEVTKTANYTCAQCRAIFKVDLGDAAPPPAPAAGEAAPAPTSPATPDSPTMKSDANAVKSALASSSSGAAAAAPAGGAGSGPAKGFPEGARCARHPDVPAVSTCARCGNFSCTTCSVSLPQGHHCPDCAARLRSDGRTTPWDERRTRGLVPAVKETIRQILFTPTEFFRKMPREGGYESPVGFALVMSIVGVITGVLMTLGMGALGLAAMGPMGTQARQAGSELAVQMVFQSCQQVICTPIMTVIAAFVGAAFYHVGLMLTSSAKSGYEATVRVYSFATAVNVLQLVTIPLGAVGALVGLIGGPEGAAIGGIGLFGLSSAVLVVWAFAIQTIGLREAHETTTGKALLAVFFPILAVLFCCVGPILGIAVIGAIR